jgi:hypothetical protein
LKHTCDIAAAICMALSCALCFAQAQNPRTVQVSGYIQDLNGVPVAGASVSAHGAKTISDSSGHYLLSASPGLTSLEVAVGQNTSFRLAVDLEQDRELNIRLKIGSTVSVQAEQDALMPDPSTQGYSRDELLSANPGRPGVPLSVPGYPVETASGGIKAPQYFAPGVAGDHGEPIAQFLQVDSFLFQNNLTANAHGNGYADPNFLITPTIGDVLVDSAGYNTRYGDHSIDLAVTYAVRDRLPRFLALSSDGRDGAISAGWSPADDRKKLWVAGEALFGNGFLKRPEERLQYKLNALRAWQVGLHQLTAYGIAYYGFSRIPGLIPLDAPVVDDTIDPRQADLTHSTLALVTDNWQLAQRKTLLSGAYFRTYSLALRSNFGDGLIRQSEFRTVIGGNTTYSQTLSPKWQILAGAELRRDAPRGLDLAHADTSGDFQLVTSNDLTITTAAPFFAVSGTPIRYVRVYLGLRRDQLKFDNRDLLTPANSYSRWPGVTSPKASITFAKHDSRLPQLSFGFGKAFHANDPRIGTGSGRTDLIIQAREYQAMATKTIAGTEFRLILSKVTNSAELAKIDADTGLQEDVGPSINRFLTISARRRISSGWLQMSWSQADARDRIAGQPIPEAPRTIVDATGGWNRLPFGLNAKGEFGYVKAKPLGDGFTGVPVREIRLELNRSFSDGRWLIAVNGQLNNGYSGQTLETLAVGSEPVAFERIVGVPLRSYAAVSVNYFFGR